MADTIETIELGKAIKAGLDTALASAYPVYCSGVPTDEEGNLDDNATENVHKLPCAVVTMRERDPHGYRSVIQAYPGMVRVETNYGSDPFQVGMYTIARAVGNWLTDASTTISPSLRNFDALVVEGPPEVGVTEDNVQYEQWEITVHTTPTAA